MIPIDSAGELGLTVAVINLMPFPEHYQTELEAKLRLAAPKVRLVWLKLTSKKYSTAQGPLLNYLDWQLENLDNVDAVIISGAPVERLAFNEIEFWPELSNLINRLCHLGKPILGLCWGALALGQVLGLKKLTHKKKIFGVFQLVGVADKAGVARINMPFSTYATFDSQSIDLALTNAAFSVTHVHPGAEVGAVCLVSANQQLTLCLGHPEYSTERLLNEWERDQIQQLDDVDKPIDVDHHLSKDYWAQDCTNYFAQWFNSVVVYYQGR